MNNIEIIGYQRANLGKQSANRLRTEAYAPGVLYGGKEQIHFYVPMALLKGLVYTPKAYFVLLNIAGTTYKCILQDIQFHPVSEVILHIDFLQIFEDKKVKMHIPTILVGDAPGVVKGGRLVNKIKKMPVFAYPKDMPEHIKIDVSALDLGQMVRIHHIKAENYKILALPNTPVAVVEITRALRATAEAAESKTGKK